MNGDVFTKADFLRRIGVAESDLDAWLKEKIIRPAGFTDDKEPLFAADALERTESIRKLTELGYGLTDIQKIMKKVGLPNDKSGKKAELEKDRYFTVGHLAERSGVSPRTIKHWEDKGIIEPDMRTEGGFRLYSETYVFLCQLIRDLQLFGYSLEEIKAVSDDVRSLMAMMAGPEAFQKPEVEGRLEAMLLQIQSLFAKKKLLREGVDRWEDLLKKKRKDILGLRARNQKRPAPPAMEDPDA
jgi:DNA-binding transcriptional MerR regulator